MLSKRDLMILGLAASTGLAAARAVAGEPRNLFVVDNRLFVDAEVNGHPVRALLDSAAEATVIDPAFARRIGLVGGAVVDARGSGGDTKAALAEGVRITALGQELGPLTVALLDLSDVGRRLLKGPLDVILGRELFDSARLAIDINAGRIRALRGAVRPGGVMLPLRTELGIETFPVSVEGHAPVQAAFDLGNGSDVLVSAAFASEIGFLTDGRTVVEAKGGGIGGETSRQTFKLRSLVIAGHEIREVSAAIDATGSATTLNIGVQVLRNFRMVSDFKARQLWLRPS